MRDNIHCHDVLTAIHRFFEKPRPGEVYILGGGRQNSCSIREVADRVQELSGTRLNTEYADENRRGDHICYISDMRKLKEHYPGWEISRSLDDILLEMIDQWKVRMAG